jgi:hypothetical protein
MIDPVESKPGSSRPMIAAGRLALATAFALLLTSCGSEAQLERNRQAMDQQLAAGNASIEEADRSVDSAVTSNVDDEGQPPES